MSTPTGSGESSERSEEAVGDVFERFSTIPLLVWGPFPEPASLPPWLCWSGIVMGRGKWQTAVPQHRPRRRLPAQPEESDDRRPAGLHRLAQDAPSRVRCSDAEMSAEIPR
jgi:hypothetical protein